nr:diphthine methyltransferase [Danaus plexippus plexippus]
MEAMDIQAVESKLSDVTVTAIPMNEKMAVKWTPKWKWSTYLNADTVEWCPIEPYTHILVCSTYQLDTKDEGNLVSNYRRLGRINVLSITDDMKEIVPIQTIDASGVLDQKWCHHKIQGYPVLGLVTSEGYLQLFRLVDTDRLKLELWLEGQLGRDVLALSLDWSTNKILNEEPRLIASDTSGTLTLTKVVGNFMRKIGKWKCHSYDAWVTAFNYWNTDLFYSGGDDCLFISYDVRTPLPVLINQSHNAGVTAIKSSVDVEYQLLTGSYDEKVRLWDTRNLKRCISECEVNGGVWRLKYNPNEKSVVVAACMYGGFRLLRINKDVKVMHEYLEHESIAYGADWKYDDRSVVATCSFYDSMMHIGEVTF